MTVMSCYILICTETLSQNVWSHENTCSDVLLLKSAICNILKRLAVIVK